LKELVVYVKIIYGEKRRKFKYVLNEEGEKNEDK